MAAAPDEARMRARLETLVGIDTQNPPGREAEAGAWLAGLLAAAGAEVETVDLGEGRCNVVARIANGPGPVFAFNTHMDVVPAGEGWSSDPLRLTERDGRLYGRGACDAKGPLVAMLEAIEMLAADRAGWRGTVMGVFVADEEVASAGARHFAANGPAIDACIVGEPTSCMTIAAHKGSMRPWVRLHGVTAHSGTPDLGINAILKAGPLFEEIAAEHARIRTRSHPLVGNPSLTVTRIAGGHADNVVPHVCDLLLDRRMIPGEDEAAVKAEIAALVERAAARAGIRAEITGFKPTTGGATETAPDAPVLRVAQEVCRARHGRETPVGGFQGGCDLVHFRAMGAQGIVLGPGSLEVAHKPDEHVPAAELPLAALIYRDIARQMLGPA